MPEDHLVDPRSLVLLRNSDKLPNTVVFVKPEINRSPIDRSSAVAVISLRDYDYDYVFESRVIEEKRKISRERKEKKTKPIACVCVCTRVSVRLCVCLVCTVIKGAGIEAGNAEEYARDCKLRGYRSFRGGTSPNRSRSSGLGFEKHLTVPDAGFLISSKRCDLEWTRREPG